MPKSRLRRALGTANFWPAFPGYLPVWHGRIELSAWRALPGIMAEGFAELPPLTVPGRIAWIAAARAALIDDPAWDVPGAAPRGARSVPAGLLDEDEEEEDAPARRSWRGGLGLVLGFAATFAVGLASGVMLLSDNAPPPTVLAPPPGPPPLREVMIAPARETAPAPLPPPFVPPTFVPPAFAPPAFVPEAAVPAAATAPERAPTASVPAEPPPEPPSAVAAQVEAPPPVEQVILPLPPRPPRPPVQQHAARAPDRIDRACALAVFRFQQGQRLTAAEEGYVKSGCVTRR